MKANIYYGERYPDYSISVNEDDDILCEPAEIEISDTLYQQFLQAEQAYNLVQHKLRKLYEDHSDKRSRKP